MIQILLSFFLVVITTGEEVRDASQDPIRIISFNIRYDNTRDGLHSWGYRRHRVANILRSYRADIFGLQEAKGDQVTDIQGRFPDFGSTGIGRDKGNRGERCVIFYDRTRFKLLAASTFWLSPNPDRPGAAWGARLNRICTWGEFTESDPDSSFFVFNTHFDHQSANARARSAELLLEKIEEISAGKPVILLGDFNCQPGSVPYQALVDGTIDGKSNPLLAVRDSRDLAEEPPSGPTGTWSGFGKDDGHGRRIDFIFTRGEVQVRHHGVIPHTWNDRPASDHRPVLAEVVPYRPSRQHHVNLDGSWRFLADPENQGKELGYFRSKFDDGKWHQLAAGGPWESQGYEIDGIAWCRKWVTIPGEWQGKKLFFESEGIADEFTLYIDGIMQASVGKKGESYWRRHVEVPIGAGIPADGKKHLVVLRIVDHGGYGGLTGLPLRLTVREKSGDSGENSGLR